MERKTLEQIIKIEMKHRHENGDFGINACKQSIRDTQEFERKYNNKELSLYVLLEDFVERANTNVFFNKAMVLACWELINNK